MLLSQGSEENEGGEDDNDMVSPETDTTQIGQQTHVLPSVRVCQTSVYVPRRTEATPFMAPTPMGDEMPEETVREHRSTLFGRRIPPIDYN